MQYPTTMLTTAFLSALTLSCAQAQTDTIKQRHPETESQKKGVDSKAIESYWTTEKMKKAKPISTQPGITAPNGSISQPQSNPKK